MTKFVSWNVNGLRACVKPKTDDEGNIVSRGFEEYFKELDADFFCIQETKMQAGQLDLRFPGYHSYWCYADRKGYSGTAIFTRHEPLAVSYGIGVDAHDHEGRVITLEMPAFFLVNVYTPNSQQAEKRGQLPRRLDYRMLWERDFQAYLHSLDSRKPVVVCGDMNVAHEEIDIKNPSTNHLSAGFTDQERQQMTTLLANGFTDTFRHLYPERVAYSWWSYRFHAREKNVGWRIDYFLISDRLVPLLEDAKIHTGIQGSDHCPIELDLHCQGKDESAKPLQTR